LRSFIEYNFNHPLFGICFIFSAIPFWVPLFAYLLNGADGELMVLTAFLSLLSSAYVKSQIYGVCPWKVFLRYFFVIPLKVYFISLISVITITLLLVYGSVSPFDAAIAGVVLMYISKFFFFRKSALSHLNVEGLKRYRYINIAGGFLIAFFWLGFLSGSAGFMESMFLAAFAVVFHISIFYKVNAGMA
jgi:hypothetical protein